VDWFDLGQDRGKSGRYFKRGSELSGSIKCGKFLDQLKKFWFYKDDFVPLI